MSWSLSPRVRLASGRITSGDALRQTRTAREILRRLNNQPGVVLADEVGMGKTYVALAIAVSVIEATGGEKPVVVMVPAGVQQKWPQEWEVFAERCLKGGTDIRATSHSIRNGAEFLKLLDDPTSRRKHLIFLTHGALTNSLSDPWIKLAILRRALVRPSMADQRRAFPRWAGEVLGARAAENRKLIERLLEAHPRQWRAVFGTEGQPLADDPIPEALTAALLSIDLAPLIAALQTLPLRRSAQLSRRLQVVRAELSEALRNAWRGCLYELKLELPLLVLDEAHHLKNPGTRLASLFANPDAEKDAELIQGPFGGVFERMLFLTATPFQLGHHELIEVLNRFRAVRWGSADERAAYESRIAHLGHLLDEAQDAALRLDASWNSIRSEDVAGVESERWWLRAEHDLSEPLRGPAAGFAETREKLKRAERQLRPFVIRHTRPARDERRVTYCGRAIVTEALQETRGLEVNGPAVLPFLLAARVQSLMSSSAHRDNRTTRAYFAEGLSSSFEAYRETRLGRSVQNQLDDTTLSLSQDLPEHGEWYIHQINRALPAGSLTYGADHPKVSATANRVVELWRAREKTLVFCFYIETGRALRSHISHVLREALIADAREKLDLSKASSEDVALEVQRFANRFFDPDAPVTKVARDAIHDLFAKTGLTANDRERAEGIVLRFLRTPAFLVRYVDIGASDRAAAFEDALSAGDSSNLPLHDKLIHFGDFVADRVESERAALLSALLDIQTGADLVGASSRELLLPNVRLANGQVARETRQRLMLAFNSPFFPEVLVASSVMAEGVDLHLDCRHVIHHDLDWNPSVLEQRTGRLDRLGSKSEASGRPIQIYEPFLEGTQDEKQFRVVKDRERWFNVIMGERLEFDEWVTDQIEQRVPLPVEAAEQLTLRLEVAK
jgi:hypothetical protein